MSEAGSTTVTGTCMCVLKDLPHLMGEAQIGMQIDGAQATDIPPPDTHVPIIPQNTILLRGLATIKITPVGSLTGTDNLTEILTTQTMPLALMRKREGGNPLPVDPTMTLTAEARVPMPSMFHSKSMGTKAKHDNQRTGTVSIPLRVVTKIMADFHRETAVS